LRRFGRRFHWHRLDRLRCNWSGFGRRSFFRGRTLRRGSARNGQQFDSHSRNSNQRFERFEIDRF
jgi:hypothetical protein